MRTPPLRQVEELFLFHLSLLGELVPQRPPQEVAARRLEAFEVVQLAGDSDTAKAVAGMAARFAAGSDAPWPRWCGSGRMCRETLAGA